MELIFAGKMFAVIFICGLLEKPQKLEPTKISCHKAGSVHSVCTLRLHVPCPSPKPFIFCIIFFWHLVLGTLCPHSPSSVSVPSVHLLSNKRIARKLCCSVEQCFKVLTKLLTPADKHRYLLSYKRHSLLSKKNTISIWIDTKAKKIPRVNCLVLQQYWRELARCGG